MDIFNTLCCAKCWSGFLYSTMIGARFDSTLSRHCGPKHHLCRSFERPAKACSAPPLAGVAYRICLMTSASSSLFWPFVYGYYSHYFHEWQTARAQKEKYEADAKEFPILARGTVSVQTKAPTSPKEMADFVSERMESAAICDKRRPPPSAARLSTCTSGAGAAR